MTDQGRPIADRSGIRAAARQIAGVARIYRGAVVRASLPDGTDYVTVDVPDALTAAQLVGMVTTADDDLEPAPAALSGDLASPIRSLLQPCTVTIRANPAYTCPGSVGSHSQDDDFTE